MEIGYFLVMFLMLPVQQHHFFIADLELKLTTVFFVKDEFIGSVNYSHLYGIPSNIKFQYILLELQLFCYINFFDEGCLTGEDLCSSMQQQQLD